MSMVWTLSFKDPLLGLANIKWGGGIRVVSPHIVVMNSKQCGLWPLHVLRCSLHKCLATPTSLGSQYLPHMAAPPQPSLLKPQDLLCSFKGHGPWNGEGPSLLSKGCWEAILWKWRVLQQCVEVRMDHVKRSLHILWVGKKGQSYFIHCTKYHKRCNFIVWMLQCNL